MKKIFGILFWQFLVLAAAAQCPDELTLRFERQSSIDAFPLNFPGCTEIPGHLVVSGYFVTEGDDAIRNLDGLAQIESVAGNFSIGYLGDSVDFSGLGNLQSVGRKFKIESMEVTDLQAFANIRQVGSCTIYQCDYLRNLAGLENLAGKLEELDIIFCDSLENLVGLTSVEEMERLRIYMCKQLRSLHGIGSEAKISFVDLQDNYSFSDLNALASCGATLQRLQLSQMPKLKHLHGLEQVSVLEKGFTLSFLDSLQDLLPLRSLTSVPHFSIIKCPQLKDLRGLENLETVTSAIVLTENESLSNLDALRNVQGFTGALTIYDNQNLTAPPGFPWRVLLLEAEAFSIGGNGAGAESVEALEEISGLDLKE